MPNLHDDRFLGKMSHELRTPLNAIIGFTGTLLMKIPGPLTAEQEKQLGIIQASGNRLLALINELVDLAKIESGKVDLQFEPVICQSVVQEVSMALRSTAEAKGLVFRYLAPVQDVVVPTDRWAATQILGNLTHNAIKFTERGEVCLQVGQRCVEGTAFVELSVVDTGIGIPPEHHTSLFHPFERVHRNGSTEEDGPGLGLYMSRKLSGLLGGRITFESRAGRGSRFSLIIPEAPCRPS